MVLLDILPMEEHLPQQEASRPETFFSFLRTLLYFCPLLHRLVLWRSPLTPRRYPLILHLEISQEWRMICSCIEVSNYGFLLSNYVASIEDLWCWACASPLMLIVCDGLPTFRPIEVRLDSNVIYSVRGFSTCCLL